MQEYFVKQKLVKKQKHSKPTPQDGEGDTTRGDARKRYYWFWNNRKRSKDKPKAFAC